MRLFLAMVFVATVAAVPAQLAAAPAPPVLSVAATQPVTIHGAHFLSREWVKVSVTGARSETRRARTSATGAFSLAFPDLTFGPCSGFRVSAAASHGARVVLKIPQRACMPARNP